jgi:peptide/nickel transport system ATP-binding protein
MTTDTAVPAQTTPATDTLLAVDNLAVAYRTGDGREVRLVDGVSFSLRRGEALGLAGESGCGKTTTALALLGLLPSNLYRAEGTINLYSNRGVMHLHRRTERGFRDLRWRNISIVFQGAMNALDPVMRVCDQIAEAIRLHEPEIDSTGVKERIDELFGYVGINPNRQRQYPHEFSGGMRQRVMIALALACKPELVIGDEPTTALDVMMQAQILELLEELRRDLGLAMILITHDLSVLAETCDRIAIMYGGKIVETGTIRTLYSSPEHPYSERLLGSFPAIGGARGLQPPIEGAPPDPADLPSGCLFHPRCHRAKDECATTVPELKQLTETHSARCLFAPWPGGLTSPAAVTGQPTAASPPSDPVGGAA